MSKIDDEEEGGVVQMVSFCRAQLQKDVFRDTAHSVAKHNGPSDPSLSFFLSLFSGTAVLPAPMGNGPHVCRGLAHMHRHTAIAQELAHACTCTERKHTARFRHKRKSEKLRHKALVMHTALELYYF